MREFLVETQAFLQSVRKSDDELTLHLEEANKLAQELSDRKKQLKTAMFNDKIASFVAFPSLEEASLLGELAFAHIQLPFKKLASTELKPVDIRSDYDFVLPLDHGQHIVTFNLYFENSDDKTNFTIMSCFDRLGRLKGKVTLQDLVDRDNVAQYGPNQFIVCHFTKTPELSVYDSYLKCLRNEDWTNFSSICCNSKFLFGLWDTSDASDPPIDSDNEDHDEEDDGNGEQQEQYSRRLILVCHLDTLMTAFGLRVPEKYTMRRIMADEHHVVAMSCLGGEPWWREFEPEESRQWFISIFDLQAMAKKKANKKIVRFFRAERHIDLNVHSPWVSEVFLLDGWLVVPNGNLELVWFNKKGKRSETSTQLDNISNVRAIYSSGSSLLIGLEKNKLLLKIK